MGFSLDTSIPAFTVLLQGLLSFLSPCVLPLVPLYISYLAGGTKTVLDDGSIQYKKSRVMVNTVFFVLGISFAFFLLGFGFTAAGQFFSQNRALFARIGGAIILVFGLYQLFGFQSRFLSKEHRLPLRLEKFSMNPLIALLFGFTFSFAWTPCVGPVLASVLLMASSAQTAAAGFGLIALYTLGFVLPFLLVGLFTSTVLGFFKKHQKVVKYTVKVGGALMVLIGIMMLTGWMNGVTGYLSSFGASPQSPVHSAESSPSPTPSPEPTTSAQSQVIPAPDFTLVDQNGQAHSLSDYKGKVIFLNFWATWCNYCLYEMPDIQALYEEHGGNSQDLVVLGVANPRSASAPYNQDVTANEIKEFLQQQGFTYPTLMDTTGELFAAYGISSMPTTFMIDRDGNVFGAASGMLTREMMDSIVQQTMEGR